MKEDTDIHTERIALSALWVNGLPAWEIMSEFLSTDEFTLPANRIIFECLVAVLLKHPTCDMPAFLAEAEQLGYGDHFRRGGEIEPVRALRHTRVGLSHVRNLAMELRRLTMRRET